MKYPKMSTQNECPEGAPRKSAKLEIILMMEAVGLCNV